MGVDWTGVFSRMIPTRGLGGRRGKGSGRPREDDIARYLVGPVAGTLIGVFGMALILFVNPWLGSVVIAFSARRWADFRATKPEPLGDVVEEPTRAPRRSSKVKRPDCLSVYLETLKILGEDSLSAQLQTTMGLMRDHGKPMETCAEIALRHHEEEIREAGLNLPCFA